MTPIPYPTDEELSAEARDLLPRLVPLNLLRMFAGAPSTFRPLLDLGEAILLHGELDPRLREIAILAVALTSGSEYETVQHVSVCRSIGMPEEEIRAAAEGDLEPLGDDERLVWEFAAQVARDVGAEPDLTERVLARLGRGRATELVVACAYYSAVARIIETCGVELESDPASVWTNFDRWGRRP